jgi:hypothetical protein
MILQAIFFTTFVTVGWHVIDHVRWVLYVKGGK